MANRKTTKKPATTEKLTKETIASIDKNLAAAEGAPKRPRKRATGAAEAKAVAAADQENARLRDERAAAADGMTSSERAMSQGDAISLVTKPTRKKSKADPTEKARKEVIAAIDRNLDGKPGKKPKPIKAAAKTKRPGILDCAVAVLQGAKEPLGCQEMVQAMLERKLWTTNGRTPGATLYAAILRELQHKGKQARFEKVARGRFTLRKGV